MDLNLHEDLIGQGGIYPTNESEEILSSIQGQEEDVTSTLTPVLSDSYQVIYDGNAPDGCTVNNVPDSLNYSVFDTVSISTERPSCAGYQFKGWEIVNKDITRVGEDYFIMPEENVTIRAEWSKVTIAKSMDGTVNTMGDSIMKRYSSGTSTDYHSSTYKSKVTSIVTKDSLDVSNFDTSNVTNMQSMFYVCNRLTSLNVTNFDTSNVTTMQSMFYNCYDLTSLDLSSFDTSNVTNMSYMFWICSSLTSLDMRNADFSSVTTYSSMFSSVNSSINVIVKDSTAQSFVRARLDDANRPNATVTIASSSTLTSYRVDRVPEFRDSFLVMNLYPLWLQS